MPTKRVRPELRGLRILGWILVALSALIVVTTALDLRGLPGLGSNLAPDHATLAALASTVSRAINNLTAMVLAFIALAVPLTANMYTPRLIDVFVTDRVNLAVLTFFMVMGAFALFAQATVVPEWGSSARYVALAVGGVVGFVILFPYYLYVLSFLDPDRIIDLVAERASLELPDIVAGRRPTAVAQERLDARLRNVGNVVLRAVDRADRDAALRAIEALADVMNRYDDVRGALPETWFAVPRGRFIGAADAAVGRIASERTWVEHVALGQLLLAFQSALSKMPDAVSAIAYATREFALRAAEGGRDRVLELAVRYFNTYLRHAVQRRDDQAVYAVLYQYRRLGQGLAGSHPATLTKIARHLRYYGEFARFTGLRFIPDLVGYELAELAGHARETGSAAFPDVLEEALALKDVEGSLRLAVSRAVLAARLRRAGDASDALPVIAVLRALPAGVLAAARERIATTTDPTFWEITDRQLNLDFVPEALRPGALEVLDALSNATDV